MDPIDAHIAPPARYQDAVKDRWRRAISAGRTLRKTSSQLLAPAATRHSLPPARHFVPTPSASLCSRSPPIPFSAQGGEVRRKRCKVSSETGAAEGRLRSVLVNPFKPTGYGEDGRTSAIAWRPPTESNCQPLASYQIQESSTGSKAAHSARSAVDEGAQSPYQPDTEDGYQPETCTKCLCLAFGELGARCRPQASFSTSCSR